MACPQAVSAGRVTVWVLTAVSIWVVSLVASRGERFLMALQILVCPAVLRAVGVGHLVRASRMLGWGESVADCSFQGR